ncbi:MAG: PAS domain S-box protein [Verrucomicrobiota bacterium]|jgi:PAS domain S-box-containing protein
MTNRDPSPLVGLLEAVSPGAALTVFGVGALALAGWVFDSAVLKSLDPNLVAIKANTAVAFMLIGLSLWLSQAKRAGFRPNRLAAWAAAAVVTTLGLLTLVEYACGWNLRIDQLLFTEPAGTVRTPYPGRMAPATALTFLLAGASLLLLDVRMRHGHRPAQYLIVLEGFISLTALLGYLCGASILYSPSPLATAMSFPAAVAGLITCIGLLFARPGQRLLTLLAGMVATMTRWRKWLRFIAAILLAVLAAMLRLGLLQNLGTRNVYLTFYPAVMLAALYGGLSAGLLTAAVSAALADYYLIEPVHQFTVRDAADWLGLAIFLGSSAMISWMAQSIHRAHARARDAELQASMEAARKRDAESKALLGAIVESSDDAIFSRDLNGTIRSWNAGAERMFGYRAGEIIGKPITVLIPPQHLEEEEWILQRIKRGERVSSYDTVRMAKDGRLFDASVTVSAITDGTGQVVAVSKIVRDITERKRKEEELRRLNRTLKALYDSNQAMMRARDEAKYLEEVCQIIVQACGHAMAWVGFAENDEAKTVRLAACAGLEAGYLATLRLTWADTERGRGPTGAAIRTGKPCVCRDMRTDPAFAPWRQEALKHGFASSLAIPLLAEGEAFGAVTIYSTQPNSFSDDEVKVLTDLAGDLAQGVSTLRLRAERARSEEQLRLLSTAVESAVNGIVITDRQGHILWTNPAFTRLTGYTLEEAVGKNPRVLKSGKHPPEFYRQMWLTILRGEPWQGELVNRRKDGSLYSEEMAIAPVRASGADVTHFIAIKHDITARKRAEEALRRTADELARSNEELQQFAYVASHDLQEPLRAVAGYLSLIDERFHDTLDDKGRLQIAGAIQGAERMHALIIDLLELSRVGTSTKAFQPSDLNAALDAALSRLNASIRDSGATITRDPLPPLTVDATQMSQLFQNLIGNALKFRGKAAPEIHISAEPQPGQWLFAVRDNGIGIEPQYFERIFQIFQRLHTRKEYPGTGIGLAICKKIVERHGGRISVQSQPGRGSTFCFTIPDKQVQSAREEAPQPAPAGCPRETE